MYDYNLPQWFLFFFIYCFFGWIWESCYVSVQKHKWVNRGFLHGPLIPIYGFGALAVLIMAIPVRDNLALVFMFGMVGATAMEYVTGAVMEKLFKVRYWDYSDMPLNLNGYICLPASLGWGGFSILLIRFIHMPVETAVLGLRPGVADFLAHGLSVAFAVDTTQSFNEAMDLREAMEKLTESSQELKRIQKRMDVIAAVVGADMQERKKKAGKFRKAMDGRLSAERMIQELSENIGEYRERFKKKPAEAAQGIHGEAGSLGDEIKKLSESLGKQKQKVAVVKSHLYTRSIRILRRNPGAVSRVYKEALEEVRGDSLRISPFKHKRNTK